MINLGRHSYIGAGCEIRGGGKGSIKGDVNIGAFSSLADNVKFEFLSQHQPNRVSTFPFLTKHWRVGKGDGFGVKSWEIKIGNDVWIGSRVTILAGADLGDGCVVGAFSVVAKSVPPYAVVVGNPAKVIKYRFTPDIIQALLDIKWWNWSDDIIRSRLDDFYGNVELFVRKYGNSNKSN